MDVGDAGTVGVSTVAVPGPHPPWKAASLVYTELECMEKEREARKRQVPKLGSQDGSVGPSGSFWPRVPHHGHAAPLSHSKCDSPRPAGPPTSPVLGYSVRRKIKDAI